MWRSATWVPARRFATEHARLAPQSASVAERGELLNAHFTSSVYVNVSRSLFEKNKLLFSFLLATKIAAHAGDVDGTDWRFLLAGPSVSAAGHDTGAMPVKPEPDWLTNKMWSELRGLSQLPAFAGFAEHVSAELPHYKALFDSSQVC